jgi:hypothetical protein
MADPLIAGLAVIGERIGRPGALLDPRRAAKVYGASGPEKT